MSDTSLSLGETPDEEWLERWRTYLVKQATESTRAGTMGQHNQVSGITTLCDLALEGIKSRKKNDKPARRLAAKELMLIAQQLIAKQD